MILKSGPEREKRHFNRADLKPKDPTDQIDLNLIEIEVDEAIQDAWNKVVNLLKNEER
jgi:hypothetical protein